MKAIPDYSDRSLSSFLEELQNRIRRLAPREIYEFLAVDPDLCTGRYAGETIEIRNEHRICRSWDDWNTLARHLGCRLLTPRGEGDSKIRVRFQKLSPESFHTSVESSGKEKYAPHSPYARIRKNESPAFFCDYLRALERMQIPRRRRILDLGINRADELEPIYRLAGKAREQMEITGIDLAGDALAEARRRFPRLRTFCHDLNRLGELELGRFDLILSIGTLQSPGIEMKPLIMDLVQKHLSPDGAILLGWPNARWIDGELLYGARPKNYSFPELSLVIKDLFWIKKYLQQHRFRVVITGREYLFLEATRIL
ncbi:class I SAM-dependent methyltransferase, partial [Nitratifractor sp.]